MALLHLLTLLVLQPGLGSDPEQVLPRVKNVIEVAPDGIAKPSVSDISSRSGAKMGTVKVKQDGKIPQRVKGSVPVTKSLAEAAAHIPEKLFRSGQIAARTEDPDGSDDAKEEGGGGDDAARRRMAQAVADCRACKKKCRKNRHHREELEECREKCSKNVCSPEAKGTTEGTADGTADPEQANENGGAEGSAEGDSGNESDDEGTAEGGVVPVVAVPVVEPVVPVVEPVVAPVVPVVEPLVAVEPVVAVVPTKTGGGSLVEGAAHIPEKLIRSRTQDPDSGEANSLVAKTEDPEGGAGDDAEGGSDGDGDTNDANSTDKEKDDAEEAEGSAFRGALPGAACLIGLVAILA